MPNRYKGGQNRQQCLYCVGGHMRKTGNKNGRSPVKKMYKLLSETLDTLPAEERAKRLKRGRTAARKALKKENDFSYQPDIQAR
jgi:hypothetical protein